MPLAPRVGTIRQVQRRRPPQKVETNFATNVTDDELRRAIVSARTLQAGTPAVGGTAAAPRTVADIRHRVHRWSVLRNRPHHETAARTVERCVRVLQPLMLVLRTATLSVEEFFPRDERLLGLNTNSGQRIQVRLRPAGRPESFLPLESVLHTLAHEVTHNFISPHNRAFFELHERITSLCERLIALGAMDAPGDAPALPLNAAHSGAPAFSGVGRAVGGNRPEAAAAAAGLAERPAATGPAKGRTTRSKFPGVGRVAADGPTGTSAGPLAAAIRRRGRSSGAPDYETMRGQMLRAVLLRLAAAERAEAERHLAAAGAQRRNDRGGGDVPGPVDDDDFQGQEEEADAVVAPVCTCGTECIDVDAACADGDECGGYETDDDYTAALAAFTNDGDGGEDDDTTPSGGLCAPASGSEQDGPLSVEVSVATVATSPVVAVALASVEDAVDGPRCEGVSVQVKHELASCAADNAVVIIVD